MTEKEIDAVHVKLKSKAHEQVDPTPAVGCMVHFFDPRLAVNANDGMGQGPYHAVILKITPAVDTIPVRLHLRVSRWGSDGWYSAIMNKANVGSETPYWVWPPKV